MASPEEALMPFRSDPALGGAFWAAMMRPSCCTTAGRPVRAAARRNVTVGPYDAALRRHRAWMATSAGKEAYKLRKQIVEPVFRIIKEQQAGHRFLLRSLANVAAEWTVLATAFNLRTL